MKKTGLLALGLVLSLGGKTAWAAGGAPGDDIRRNQIARLKPLFKAAMVREILNPGLAKLAASSDQVPVIYGNCGNERKGYYRKVFASGDGLDLKYLQRETYDRNKGLYPDSFCPVGDFPLFALNIPAAPLLESGFAVVEGSLLVDSRQYRMAREEGCVEGYVGRIQVGDDVVLGGFLAAWAEVKYYWERKAAQADEARKAAEEKAEQERRKAELKAAQERLDKIGAQIQAQGARF